MPQSPDSVRPEVLGFKPYSAGLSIDEISCRYGLDRVVKLASNENPLGVSPLVREAIERNAGLVFRYTQSGNPRLVSALAARHGVDPATVVLGNGSDEVIDLLIRCRAEPGKHNLVTNRPCFSLYPLQARLCGVELRQEPLNPDFTFNWQGLRARVDDDTALVFITTPDNPSGYCPPAAEVEAFARSLPAGALLVVDEAYMDLCGNEAAHSLLGRIAEFPNLAVLRTFSKSYGLAGLRLGYGIMPAGLADYLCRVRLPFSINCLAEAAGLAALQDDDFLEATKAAVIKGRKDLYDGLAALGCRVRPTLSNFLIFRLPEKYEAEAGPAEQDEPGEQHGRGSRAADRVFGALLERGIIIRQLKSYDLPQWLRVSVGNEQENRLFLQELKNILG